MEKTAEEFDRRNEKKKQIDAKKRSIHDIRIGEVWRYHEGMNVGSEQSKGSKSDFRRVGIVISKKPGNNLVYILPLTSKYYPKYSRFQMKILNAEQYGLPSESAIIINQIKIISKSRLITRKKLTRPISNLFLKSIIAKALRFLK